MATKRFIPFGIPTGEGPAPQPTPTQEKSVTLTSNGQTSVVTPSSGYLLSKVTAKAQITTEHKVVTEAITANGTYSYTPTDAAHPMDSITIPVNVSGGGGESFPMIAETASGEFFADTDVSGQTAKTVDVGMDFDMLVIYAGNPDVSPWGTSNYNIVGAYVYNINGSAASANVVKWQDGTVHYAGGSTTVSGTSFVCSNISTARFRAYKYRWIAFRFDGAASTTQLSPSFVTSVISDDKINIKMGDEAGKLAELPVEEVKL